MDVVPTVEAATPAALDGATVLVIDVLRASTTIVAALRSGCAGVLPAADPAAARRRLAGLPPGRGCLAGERRGEPIPGFDLGNSPLEMTPARVQGRWVVLTTSNGTRALLAARRAARVGVAALVNLGAAAAWARAGGRAIVLLCAGERGRPALEDQVAAGLLVERLLGADPAPAPTAAAAAALALARPYRDDVARLAIDAPWARRLADRGRAADVRACLALDTTTLVPVYLTDVDKVLAGPR